MDASKGDRVEAPGVAAPPPGEATLARDRAEAMLMRLVIELARSCARRDIEDALAEHRRTSTDEVVSG